jgi:hypothetical protein
VKLSFGHGEPWSPHTVNFEPHTRMLKVAKMVSCGVSVVQRVEAQAAP